MKTFNLSALQSVMLHRLSHDKGMTGYDICKHMTESGYKWRHQQIYRELGTMPLTCTIQPQSGKPDRKLYTLTNDVEFIHDYKLVPIALIEEAGLVDIAETKINWLRSLIERAKQPYDVERYKFDINYLESIIAKHLKKAA